MGTKFYVASTILINEFDKYELFDDDSDKKYSLKDINNMNLLFLTKDSVNDIVFYGVPEINNTDVYYADNLHEIVRKYFHFDIYEYTETVENNITDDLTDKIVFISETNKKYSIVSFNDIYEVFISLRDIYEEEFEEDIDYDELDGDSIMQEVLNNSVSKDDISTLAEIIEKQIDRKNHTIMEFNDSDINSDDIKSTILGLMNNSISGTILFVHNVAGLSSSFDFYVENGDILFVDDTISYIFPHMMKKCFEKSTKMILVVNIDNQIIDNVDLKENYIFNMYMKRNKYVLENVNINKYKDAFIEQFNSEPLICHYVLCDMKGNKYLTFDC